MVLVYAWMGAIARREITGALFWIPPELLDVPPDELLLELDELPPELEELPPELEELLELLLPAGGVDGLPPDPPPPQAANEVDNSAAHSNLSRALTTGGVSIVFFPQETAKKFLFLSIEYCSAHGPSELTQDGL